MEGAAATAGRAERISKLQRWLDLIAFLLQPRLPVTADVLLSALPAYAARWTSGDLTARDTAKRTFDRDKEELRKAGIRIETVEGGVREDGEERDGYRLADRDLYLPMLRLVSSGGRLASRLASSHSPPREVELREDEARLAIEGLRHVASLPGHLLAREARSALRKLTFDLDRFAFPAGPVFLAPAGGAVADPATLRDLFDALTSRVRVRFRYRGIARNRVTRRHVAPYALLFLRGRWYLAGRDERRRAVRIFRVSRIVELEDIGASGQGPEYEVPADFDAAAYIGREAWELEGEREPTVARVRFRFPSSVAVSRLGAGEVVEEAKDGSVVRDLVVSDPDAFVRWLLSFQGEAEVLEPRAIRTALRKVARDVARLHAPRRPPRRIERPEQPRRRRRRAHE